MNRLWRRLAVQRFQVLDFAVSLFQRAVRAKEHLSSWARLHVQQHDFHPMSTVKVEGRVLIAAIGIHRADVFNAALYVHWRAILLLLALSIASSGCWGKRQPVVQPPPPPRVEVVTVEVPTIVKATPPAELLTPVNPPLPMFISPFDPDATSALTADGERLLRGLLEELLGKLRAWQKWAEAEK